MLRCLPYPRRRRRFNLPLHTFIRFASIFVVTSTRSPQAIIPCQLKSSPHRDNATLFLGSGDLKSLRGVIFVEKQQSQFGSRTSKLLEASQLVGFPSVEEQ